MARIWHPQLKYVPYHGVIILDGPDGVGKTTLAKELIRQIGSYRHYVHLSYRYPEHMFTYQLAALHFAHKWCYWGVSILDRHWISEGIYANVYRGGSKWPHMGRMMDRAFRGMPTMTILCLPESVEEHEAYFQKLRKGRPEMYDSQVAVTQRYMDLWSGNVDCTGSDYAAQLTRLGGVSQRDDFMRYRIGIEGQNIVAFAQDVINKMHLRWQMQCWIATKRHNATHGPETQGYNHNFGGFLDTAEWLILGDMCNPKFQRVRYPFLDHSNSSLFLSDCLHEIGFDETRAVYINVNDFFGGNGVIAALKEKPNLRILCLGNDALRGLKDRCKNYLSTLAIFPEIYKTCHPSYAQRFNQREMLLDDLSNLLGVRDDRLSTSTPSN